MDALYVANCFTASTNSSVPRFSPILRSQKSVSRITSFSLVRASIRPVSELVEDGVLQMFFEDRELNGDIISKVSDKFWQTDVVKFVNAGAGTLTDIPEQVEQVVDDDNEGGFLKLSRTQEWLSGDNSAPINKKVAAKALKDDSQRRKKFNLLKYEALKRELVFLSVGVGAACSGYCLIVFSVQAAISYMVGVLFSCLYLQLLFQHVDNLSKEMVPQIFMKKKSKKIGIRSEDLKDFFERSFKGSSVALSSPRLVIPAAIYGLWILSHRYAGDLFDFQIVPAMFGMFVYKAAALVQVYRDNEDLNIIFPEY
ncbi:hypothetical protein HS088_TW02G00723 [Tripterygium wilfordii]|uniref:Uncharacterized protein n=1 Tax=Tripterygium wilfordii TaxID=458696 RepID=A0A7J7E058_TRIWF|nr:uncharacterized protein LOC120015459 [Tripterygium wilfordii]XP_038723839.1 uncharacterized protein LOC120015459 [Tripterygium wilfordii]KAF5751706.1 hypothetical protein HS088_TW02G00723 [Tripterygium wilfordii]